MHVIYQYIRTVLILDYCGCNMCKDFSRLIIDESSMMQLVGMHEARIFEHNCSIVVIAQ